MQQAQDWAILHITRYRGKFKTRIQGIGPGEPSKRNQNAYPCLPVTHNGKEIQTRNARLI